MILTWLGRLASPLIFERPGRNFVGPAWRIGAALFLSVLGILNAKAAGPPRAEAAFTSKPPVVDGRLDDGEWSKAEPISFPSSIEAAEASLSEVRMLWTEAGVYVAFRTVDSSPAFGHFKPGEPLFQEDVFEMFIDQAGDHRQYYEIQASPKGQVFIKNYVLTAPPRLTAEGRLTPEFCESEYWRYDWPVPEGFQIASRFDKETGAWTMEIFLPSALVNRRHAGKPLKPAKWRLNLVRHDWDLPKDAPGRKAKYFYWAPILEGHPHMSPTLMGYLELKKP